MVVDGTYLGTSITFADVTESHALQAELERSRRELETAYEEIQSTVEELETTNEELQSTNEELETTNEELQSTNEELETMNEELQSTNEELETINTELHDRTSELNQGEHVPGVRARRRAGRRDRPGQRLQRPELECAGRRALGPGNDDVLGKSVFALDFGLPVDQLRDDIRTVTGGSAEVAESVVGALNRRGREFQCKVLVTQMQDGDGHAARCDHAARAARRVAPPTRPEFSARRSGNPGFVSLTTCLATTSPATLESARSIRERGRGGRVGGRRPEAVVDAIVLCTGEAITNAALHAYQPPAGPTASSTSCVERSRRGARRHRHGLRGGIRRRPRDAGEKGFGLKLIERLTSRYVVSSGRDAGTTVRMVFALRPRSSLFAGRATRT